MAPPCGGEVTTAGSYSVVSPFVDYQGDPVYAGSEDHWSNVLARARGGPHPAGITAKER
jgi:hypothetical protein